MTDDPREPGEEPTPDDAADARAGDRGDVAETDAEPDAAVAAGMAEAAERSTVDVRVRTTPRYGRFMALGALVGFLGGWALSSVGSSGPWLGEGQWTDTSSVLPFMMLLGAVVGLVLGAVVAIVLDRTIGRRRRDALAERTRHRA